MEDWQKIRQRAGELVKQLTAEEKARLCSGVDDWHLAGIERLGLSPAAMTDGSNGVRAIVYEGERRGESVPATCFPPMGTIAASFDTELIEEMGEALGEECLWGEISMLLGPGCNIKRSPLCGRNFEYLSEDPLLAGKMAAGLVRGIQKKGVGATLKHFACNNQETYRMVTDAVVDERALREIYLKPFEIAVKEGKAANVMCSYNRINGTYTSDHKWLLKEVLRKEFGFDGLVVSDWGAMNDWVKSLEAGMDLAMPGNGGGRRDKALLAALKNGTLSSGALDQAAEHALANLLTAQRQKKEPYDREKHARLARKAGTESAVLLENNGILPLSAEQRVEVYGKFAKEPRYQGAGSSQVMPHRVISFCDALEERGIRFSWRANEGVRENSGTAGMAENGAEKTDVAIVFVGLPEHYEAESCDRPHMNIPEEDVELVRRLKKERKQVVAVVQGGSSMYLPFRKEVDGLLFAGLTGQENGYVIADLLFGDANPCGRLEETWPLPKQSQKLNGFGEREALYTESIYVGYRYYDTFQKDVQYPFGYGLSYTSFTYSNLKVSHSGPASEIKPDEKLTVSVDVTNIGSCAGKEVVQIYVQAPESRIYRPKRELKGFSKIRLEPGETGTVFVELEAGCMAYYHTGAHCWHTADGTYTVGVGKNSREMILEAAIQVKGESDIAVPDYRKTAPEYYDLSGKGEFSEKSFAAVYGKLFPKAWPERPFHVNSTVGDLFRVGWIAGLYRKLKPKMMKPLMDLGGDVEADASRAQMVEMIVDNALEGLPLRNLVFLSNGAVSPKMLRGMIGLINLFAGKEKTAKENDCQTPETIVK